MLSILYPTNRQGCYGVRILWRGIQAYVINMNNAYQGCTTVLSTYNVPANMLIGEEKYLCCVPTLSSYKFQVTELF